MGQRVPPAMPRRVRLFGALHIETAQRSVSLTGSKLQSLFAFLLLHPDTFHTRDHLANLLFPDAPPERVRRHLSDTLYRLRQALGEAWLVVDSQRVGLRAGPDLVVDVWQFEQLCSHTDLSSLEQAVALYGGDLLPEIYDDWILVRRVALHEKYLSCLLRLGEASEQHNRPAAALEYYQRLAHADPLREEAHRGLMRMYARLGRYSAALQQYARLGQLLTAELQSTPLPETVALAATIRTEYQATLKAAAPPKPFVGRQPERTLLLRHVEQTQHGRGCLVLLEGQPGIGKTRLLELLAESARWRGLTVVTGRAQELDAVTPYAPLDQAFQAALVGARSDQIQAQLSPVMVAALSALAPRLRSTFTMHLVAPPNMPAALTEGWRLLTQPTPYLLILDDMQWAGSACWEALQFTAHLATMPLMVVLAYRPDDVRASPDAWQALRALDRELAPPRLRLAGLTAAECNELACELGYTLTANQLTMLHHSTDGNPLYVQETLTGHDPALGPAPLLNTLLQRRLNGLSATARAVLEIAAVLGREFTHSIWHAIGGNAVFSALPELVAQRFIQETAAGYSFQHDLTREQTYQSIPSERLRALHAQAADALAREHADPATLAWHSEQAQRWALAERYHRLAGEQALRSYTYHAALHHFDRALDLLSHLNADPASEYLTLLCRRMRVLGVVGPVPALRADVDAIERVAATTGNPAALLEALEARVALLSVDSQPDTMQATAERALALARELDDRSAEARILRTYNLYRILVSSVRPVAALPELQRAVALAESVRDYPVLVAALCTLAFTNRLIGRSDAAYMHASRALALAETYPELAPARANAVQMLAEVALNRSEWELARATMRTAIGLLEGLNDKLALAIAYFMFTAITCAMGQHAEALTAANDLQELVRTGQVPPDSNWALYVYACAIETSVQAGDLAAAEQIACTVYGLIDCSQDVQATIYLLTSLGSLRLVQNQPRDALGYLTRAVHLWQEAPSAILSTPLLHAVAAYLTGSAAAARVSLALVEQEKVDNDVTYYDVLYFFTRFLVYGSPADLHAAHTEIQRQAALFRDERLRAAFLQNVRLNRMIERLWRVRPLAPTIRSAASLWVQFTQLYRPGKGPRAETEAHMAMPHRAAVSLARADAPLGRKLSDTDYAAVTWTVYAPEDEQFRKPDERRRHVLRRLIEEAATQGAAPTDDDLAAALGVSRRTILRDMEHLARSGVPLPTRRRRA